MLCLGSIAQLVEHCTGNAKVVCSNPVQSLNFFHVIFPVVLWLYSHLSFTLLDGLQKTPADILHVRRILIPINKGSIFVNLGGFYQDSLAQKEIVSYGTGCKACPPGTYVHPSRAPGKAESDCLACPKGEMSCYLGFYHWLSGMQFAVH